MPDPLVIVEVEYDVGVFIGSVDEFNLDVKLNVVFSDHISVKVAEVITDALSTDIVFNLTKIDETAVFLVVEVVDGIIEEAVDIKAISDVSIGADVEAIRAV